MPTADIQIFLNTAVTSRIYASGFSEALLIIDEPGSGLVGTSNTQLPCNDPGGRCAISGTGTGVGTYDGSAGRPNIFPGTISGNTVTFHGIPIDPPGSGGHFLVLRLTNIRANTTALSNGGIGTPVIASISIPNSTQSILLTNTTPTVGLLQPGLSISGRSPDNASGGAVTAVASCSSPQRAGVIRFSEPFGDAWKPRTFATYVNGPAINGDASPTPVAQNIPGTIYNTESGFYNPALTSPVVNFGTVGLADYGTRVKATISMPAGSRVWVSLRNVTYSGGNPSPATSGTLARLVNDATGAFSPTSATATLEGVPAAELVVPNGSSQVSPTWEVLGTNSSAMENLDFVVWVQGGYAAGTGASFAPAPSTAQEQALYAAASATLPAPRFSPNSPVAGLFTTSGGCPVSTSIALSASGSNIISGTPVLLTATVTSPGGSPTGTVSFFDSAAPAGSASLSNGTAAVVVTPSLGTHIFSASYNGLGGFLQSVSPAVTVTVQTPARSGATLTLASGNSPSIVGQGVTFTATVSGSSGTPTGSVRFVDGNQTLGSSTLNGGQANFTTSFTGARTHDVFAFYSGDSAYSDASTRFGQIVNPVTATIALSVNPLAATSGQLIGLAAQLSAAPSGAPAATGAVQFFDGAIPLGSSPLANSAASLNTSVLSAGSHQIVAAYSGDSNWYSVRSLPVTVSIGAAASTTILTANFTSTRTTLSAAVSGPGNTNPAGTVLFTDVNTGTVLGRSTVTSGAATLTLPAAGALPLAGHSVTAAYSGCDSLQPGTSSPVVLMTMVNAAGNLSSDFAAEELTTIFGSGFGETPQQAGKGQLPEALGGIALTIADAAGKTRSAGLFYLSAGQVNFVLPAGLAPGAATFTLYRAGAAIYTVQAMIAPVAPGIFTVSGDGRGPAAAQISRDGENLYLVLYGTGIRNHTSSAAVTCLIDGQPVPVLYAGSQADFAGLDQVNVLIPASLRGVGPVSLMLMVDGQSSNTASVTLK